MIMPIVANIGNVMFVLVLGAGAALAIGNVWGITLGSLAAFLQLTKSFSMPVSMISQQANAIIMALAGADRIFQLIDQKKENDEGYVRLVNVVKKENGDMEKSEKRTGHWAWTYKDDSGKDIFVELKGDVLLEEVSFDIIRKKTVLKQVNVFANPDKKLLL
jgi:ATP-binding cassette subfamily B protein